MSDGEAVPNVAALVVDGVALSESLLAGDLSEARFRAHIIASHAVGSHLRDVHSTAAEVVRLLGEPGSSVSTAILDPDEYSCDSTRMIAFSSYPLLKT
jgi:hypothetical protein